MYCCTHFSVNRKASQLLRIRPSLREKIEEAFLYFCPLPPLPLLFHTLPIASSIQLCG